MLRICLSLLIAAASTGALAREVKHSAPGDACPGSTQASRPTAARDTAPAPQRAPARESKVKPSLHGDAPATNRLQPQRWHNLLPGMFR